ncbi:MAG TPA: YciI family protein [Fimbriimonadaceae bacterium]|nr:YciI family protein [Fimbriimonadaceae bacterium]
MSQHYVYFIKPCRETFLSDATDEELALVGAHFEYLKAALEQGQLVLAGRTDQQFPIGIAIYSAESGEEAEEFMRADPAVKAGVFTGEFHPFGIALTC